MVEQFAIRMIEMMKIEQKAEFLQLQQSPEELLKEGNAIMDLTISKKTMTIWSGCVVEFELKRAEICNIRKNQFVKLLYPGNQDKITGAVEEINQSRVRIAINPARVALELPWDVPYSINLIANDIVYKRMLEAMQRLENSHDNPPNVLIEMFFDERDPSVPDLNERQQLNFFNHHLNQYQRDAVEFALAQPEVAIIHGPPGTGKTTTLVEIILQLVKMDLKVLVCASSNIAVDNLALKLGDSFGAIKGSFPLAPSEKHKFMIRYGHPSRVHPSTLQYSYAIPARQHRNYKKIQWLTRKLNKIMNSRTERKNIDQCGKYLSNLKELKKQIISDILKDTNLIATTLSSISEETFADLTFDLVVIDECSQALEMATWLALLKTEKCILVGDHMQLPPTVKSHDEEVRKCLQMSLMERLLNKLGNDQMILLTRQYRMHQVIQDWPSSTFYKCELQPDDSVKGHLLSDLEEVKEKNISDKEGLAKIPLLLIDTVKMNLRKEICKGRHYKYNKCEADLVYIHVCKLINLGVRQEHIGVISSYSLQVKHLKIILVKFPGVEVNSIDGFQGRENEAIILSLVRSNTPGYIGFLKQWKRMNVAVTRARRHLAVICDSQTIGRNDIFNGFLNHIRKSGSVVQATQYAKTGMQFLGKDFYSNLELYNRNNQYFPNDGYDYRQHHKPKEDNTLFGFIQKGFRENGISDSSSRDTNGNYKNDYEDRDYGDVDDSDHYSTSTRIPLVETKMINRSDTTEYNLQSPLTKYKVCDYNEENDSSADELSMCDRIDEITYINTCLDHRKFANEGCSSWVNGLIDKKLKYDSKDTGKLSKSLVQKRKNLSNFLKDNFIYEDNGIIDDKNQSEFQNKNSFSILKMESQDEACSSKVEINKRNLRKNRSKSKRRSKSIIKPKISNDDNDDILLNKAINENKTCAMDDCSNAERTASSCGKCFRRYCNLHIKQDSHRCMESTRPKVYEYKLAKTPVTDVDMTPEERNLTEIELIQFFYILPKIEESNQDSFVSS